ncbi:hypothetical protein [Kitasatospora terrestris]
MLYRYLVPPPQGFFGSERALADHVLGRLAAHFLIEREVEGRYPDGRTVRIDAVLRPRDPSGWFDVEPVFGIEFKLPDKINSVGEFGAQIAQASDYAHCTFDGYGRLTIFLCPSPVSDLLTQADRKVGSMVRTLEETCKVLAETDAFLGLSRTAEAIEAQAREWERRDRERLAAIEAGARAEGYKSALDREKERVREKAVFAAHLLGQLGVGELMPHTSDGWVLLRSGERVWSEKGGPRRSMGTLRPKVGNR